MTWLLAPALGPAFMLLVFVLYKLTPEPKLDGYGGY